MRRPAGVGALERPRGLPGGFLPPGLLPGRIWALILCFFYEGSFLSGFGRVDNSQHWSVALIVSMRTPWKTSGIESATVEMLMLRACGLRPRLSSTLRLNKILP